MDVMGTGNIGLETPISRIAVFSASPNRSDNMDYTLVTFRTTDYRYKQFAAVPNIYLPDLLDWIRDLPDFVEIVSIRDNYDGPGIVPVSWPSYGECMNYIRTLAVVASVR